MFISKKRYAVELGHSFDKGFLSGQSSILNVIRRSETINIVHGNFNVENGATLKNSSVFVVPKNIGICVTGKKSLIEGNYITHKSADNE